MYVELFELLMCGIPQESKAVLDRILHAGCMALVIVVSRLFHTPDIGHLYKQWVVDQVQNHPS